MHADTSDQMDKQYSSLTNEYSAKPVGYYDLSRPEMSIFVPRTCKRILEVGCSAGAFGSLLKKQIPEVSVWGIEPDSNAASVAASRLDKVINSTFHSGMVDLNEIVFDAICFNDVLEHMINPEEVLRLSKQYLSQDGVVVASIPNILYFYQISKILIEQDWKYEESGILDNTHLRFFTKKSIVRLFESAGFEVLKIEGINAGFGNKYRLMNFLLAGRLNDWKYEQFAVQAKPI